MIIHRIKFMARFSPHEHRLQRQRSVCWSAVILPHGASDLQSVCENTPKLQGQHDLRWRLWIRLTPRFCHQRNEEPVFFDKLVHPFFQG
jgi:hypothetical protein